MIGTDHNTLEEFKYHSLWTLIRVRLLLAASLVLLAVVPFHFHLHLEEEPNDDAVAYAPNIAPIVAQQPVRLGRSTSRMLVERQDGVTTTTAAAEQDPEMLSKLEDLGIHDYTVYRNPGNSSASDARLPVVMLVHHREFFAGCHSFERYFSPKWETIFVLEQDFVDNFHLHELAQTSNSPAVHFATVQSTDRTGEWLGRAVALRIMKGKQQSSPSSVVTPPLLFSTHCDVHPLPAWHKNHVPFEQVVTNMVTEFLHEDEQNRQGKTNINEILHLCRVVPLPRGECLKAFSQPHRPLFVMNTALVETLPSTDSLKGSAFHAWQVGLKNPWKKRFSKPLDIAEDKPWMSDISTWVEDHLTLYNATLLEEVLPRFTKVAPTISAGDKAIPSLLFERRWKAVRLNDVPLFYDIAKDQFTSSGSVGRRSLLDASNYRNVSMDWLRHRAVSQLSNTNSPFGCLEEYMRLRVEGQFDVKISCIVGTRHLQRNHIPPQLWEQPVRDNVKLAIDFMEVWGFTHVRTTEHKLIFVGVHTDPSPTFMPFFDDLAKGNDQAGMYMSSIQLSFGQGQQQVLDWQLLEVDLDATLSPSNFFGRSTNLASAKTVGRNEYERAARKICGWLRSPDQRLEVPNSSSDVSTKDIIAALAPLASECHEGFPW